MNIQELVQRQRRYFDTGATRPLVFRRRQLRALRAALLAARPEIEQALKADLDKSRYETFLTELAMVVGEIDDALRHLEKWAAPRRRATPLSHFPAVSRVYPEPYGVVLVLSPWNYPLQLALAPVVEPSRRATVCCSRRPATARTPPRCCTGCCPAHFRRNMWPASTKPSPTTMCWPSGTT